MCLSHRREKEDIGGEKVPSKVEKEREVKRRKKMVKAETRDRLPVNSCNVAALYSFCHLPLELFSNSEKLNSCCVSSGINKLF